MKNTNPFQSFWMGGYECSDHLNAFGIRVDLINTSGHLSLIDTDYKNLSPFKISTVREGIRWSKVETEPYKYDWTDVVQMIQVGKKNNIQQMWDLCHFGYPDDLTPLHPQFTNRFTALCSAFVKFYRSINTQGTLIITPMNEVGFLSWLGGDVKGTSPYCINQGWEVKYNLMKAYIKGVEAILTVDASVRILTTEPLVNVVPCMDATMEEIQKVKGIHSAQFQVTDILSGRMCPELGGKEEYLDIIGYNYYYNNQWVSWPYQLLGWNPGKLRLGFEPLHQLLITAYKKYARPFIIAETSHPKEDRPLWVDMLVYESQKILQANLPFWGICWYPLVNRPDWDYLDNWHYAGIWDDIYNQNHPQRVLYKPCADALLSAQSRLNK